MQSDPGESRKLYCGAKVPSCKIWRNHFVFKASFRRIKFNNVRVSMTGHLSRGSNPALTQKSCVGFLRPSETTQINWRRLIYSWPKFGLEIRQRGRAEDRPHLTRRRSFLMSTTDIDTLVSPFHFQPPSLPYNRHQQWPSAPDHGRRVVATTMRLGPRWATTVTDRHRLHACGTTFTSLWTWPTHLWEEKRTMPWPNVNLCGGWHLNRARVSAPPMPREG
jgi:hypothetical protein